MHEPGRHWKAQDGQRGSEGTDGHVVLRHHARLLPVVYPPPSYSFPSASSVMLTTTPPPTVLPPSRMAKRCFSSMAMGVISSTFMVALSPGMIISVPAGSVHCPVTSVVRK